MDYIIKPDVFGKCIACDINTAIKCPTCGSFTINEQYKERKFMLSDNSLMKVAFCQDCAEKVKEEDFGWIMKNIVLGWEVTIEKGSHTEEQKQKIRERHSKLRIIDFA